MEHPGYREFIEVNRAHFESLAQHVEQFVRRKRHGYTLYKSAQDPLLQLVSGGYSPNFFPDAPKGTEAVDLARRAEEENATLEQVQTQVMETVLRWIASENASERPYDLEVREDFFPHDHVVWDAGQYVESGPGGTKGEATIVEFYAETSPEPKATGYIIQWIKEGIQEDIVIIRLGDRIVNVVTVTSFLQDELHMTVRKIFGEQSIAGDVLAGKYATKDEITEALDRVAQSVRGILPEEEVKGVLEQVRRRGFANLENQALGQELLLPNVEKIKLFTERLKAAAE